MRLVESLKSHPLVNSYSQADERSADETRQLFWRTIEKEYPKLALDESGWLFMELFDELLGSGAIGPAMRDPSMREVQVLSHDQIFAQNMIGKLKTGLTYESAEHLEHSIRNMIAKLKLTEVQGTQGKYEYHAPNQYHLTINLQPSESEPEFLKVKSALAN